MLVIFPYSLLTTWGFFHWAKNLSEDFFYLSFLLSPFLNGHVTVPLLTTGSSNMMNNKQLLFFFFISFNSDRDPSNFVAPYKNVLFPDCTLDVISFLISYFQTILTLSKDKNTNYSNNYYFTYFLFFLNNILVIFYSYLFLLTNYQNSIQVLV